ncbi:hypothetical protein GCM10025868_33590 [Angustibacter aerolatus]|uniref:Co-chaperonin GroES n=1 Tax=Angustibacter aerolatus TaxID=1162965 RepID=A0ABQ6JJP3_9ACTN|nr:hypothetical protein GCM10025868_33590 [Angustibacter aerolatus]
MSAAKGPSARGPRAQPRLGEGRGDQGGVVALGAQPLAERHRLLLVVRRQPGQQRPPLGGEQGPHAGQIHPQIVPGGRVSTGTGTQVDRVLTDGLDSVLALSPRVCQPAAPARPPRRRAEAAPHTSSTHLSTTRRGGQQVSVSIKPLEDRIVVQAVEAETTTASGLVIPDTAKEKPQEGKVLAIGPGRIDDKGNRVPLDVQVGDKVIYSKYGGTEVKYSGEEYLILSARDVLAVVEA